jgi:hypothetical protein
MHVRRWTVRPLELGRTAIEASASGRRHNKAVLMRIRLEVYDGGGCTPSHGVWRLEGKVTAIVKAAQA